MIGISIANSDPASPSSAPIAGVVAVVVGVEEGGTVRTMRTAEMFEDTRRSRRTDHQLTKPFVQQSALDLSHPAHQSRAARLSMMFVEKHTRGRRQI